MRAFLSNTRITCNEYKSSFLKFHCSLTSYLRMQLQTCNLSVDKVSVREWQQNYYATEKKADIKITRKLSVANRWSVGIRDTNFFSHGRGGYAAKSRVDSPLLPLQPVYHWSHCCTKNDLTDLTRAPQTLMDSLCWFPCSLRLNWQAIPVAAAWVQGHTSKTYWTSRGLV